MTCKEKEHKLKMKKGKDKIDKGENEHIQADRYIEIVMSIERQTGTEIEV